VRQSARDGPALRDLGLKRGDTVRPRFSTPSHQNLSGPQESEDFEEVVHAIRPVPMPISHAYVVFDRQVL
jgi:hypothetical protein